MSNQIPWLTAEYIQKFLLSPLYDQELKLKDFDVTSGAKPGDGFLSQIFRIKIDGTRKKISIIAKVLLNNSTLESIQGLGSVYDKEKFILQTFLPKSLLKLPKPVKFFPGFYHGDDDKQTLFLEDLCEDGYQLCDHKSNGLDLQHSLLVVEVLANLHASSYLVFKDSPSLAKNFENCIYSEENRSFVENLVINARKGLMGVIEDWKLPEEYKNKLKNADDWASRLIKTCERKENQINVLVQTDCWVNNLMFKYNKNEVEAVKMIDFQIVTYRSFAIDVANFMFGSTSADVKINHLNTLMERYYESFTEITGRSFNFSKERFWEEFNDRLFVGFFAMVCWWPTLLIPHKTESLDLDAIARGENNDGNTKFFQNPKFLNCLETLMPYFVEHGVI